MKRILTISFIIMLLVTIIQFRSTYALYKSQKTDQLQLSLGVWSVKVNGTDISSGNADAKFEITDEYLYFEESEYVDGNYIAPGSEGHFDILLDATDTDVSIKYAVQMEETATLKIETETFESQVSIPIEILGVEDIFVKGSDVDTTTERINYVDTENMIVYGVIPLSVIDAGYNGRIRVKFKWSEEGSDELDTMLGNDEIGTKLGFTTGSDDVDEALTESSEQPRLSIPIKIELTQYMGEDLAQATEVTNPVVATP